ncbi:cobyrinate a,c-diamide synthase [Lipingzhangella sp. LS1_29]|uniref:Hydrogenobyrinate a,c-diamide synthase n=1 Tax=Lipingzhangella rawalii TaxID=2055835 RepID=A0ABU2H702_9ACTN|nr:cobyrinate a,c-diamide synthase [Lipingzhangella rawalii]MDS1271075.1 cobyrinate a,c-diamide synthase [Lipingzhangella rawalii]
MTQVPRVVIAAPHSGSGKTTVATGLMAALAARGHRVSGHKVGPDYIDPGYHALATGRHPRNLDPVLCGPERVAPLFRHGAHGADVAVIEGVMGLFDGAAQPDVPFDGPGDFASTAHVATLVGAPVILVVDAARSSRSIAALIHGFRSFDPRVRIAGIILNQVGSQRHEELLRAAVAETGLPVLGVLRRNAEVSTPSRHLGLIPATERGTEAGAAVAALGATVDAACDLAQIHDIARTAEPLSCEPWNPETELALPQTHPRVRIAMAGGAAFTFSYREQVELLEAGGAEVVPVDPLQAPRLPGETAALIIGGGFPEEHASDLSANQPLREAVAKLTERGAPVVAECAGLLYLCRSLDGLPMAGVLPARAEMTPRLTLGYRSAVAVRDSVLGPAGTRVHGHEFHRTATTPPSGPDRGANGRLGAAWQWNSDGPEGFANARLHASYLHVHWAGAPELARRFLAATAQHYMGRAA